METIMRASNGLWYSKGEGKVRQEWVYEICRNAHIDPFELEENVWHEIPLNQWGRNSKQASFSLGIGGLLGSFSLTVTVFKKGEER